jgi:hypothetical protein
MMQLNLIQFLFFDVQNLTAKKPVTKLARVRIQQQNTYKQNAKRDSLYSSSSSSSSGSGSGSSSIQRLMLI